MRKLVSTLGVAAVLSASLAACTINDNSTTIEGSGGDGGTGTGGSSGDGGTGTGGSSGDGGTAGATGGSGGGAGEGGEAGEGASSGGDGGTSGSGATGGTAGVGGSGASGGSAGTAGTGGEGSMCLGDEEASSPPTCDSLSYADQDCSNEPPLGVVVCEEYTTHGTAEVSAAMFECLTAIDGDAASDACDEVDNNADHFMAVADCLDSVAVETCQSTLAAEKCAIIGCDEVASSDCEIRLSAFSDTGIQHIIDCTNEHAGPADGGGWGGGDPPGGGTCGEVFDDCILGVLQPTP